MATKTNIPIETELRYRAKGQNGSDWVTIRARVEPSDDGKCQLTVSGLKENTEYEFQIRNCYPQEYGGACSEWSSTKTVKTASRHEVKARDRLT